MTKAISFRVSACCFSSTLVMAFAAPAIAQSGGVGASSNADDGGAGDYIVVTARRAEESLQDVPASITVIDDQQIADRNISVGADLATYTPSLSLNQRFGPEKSSFAIRGFAQETDTAPSVGVYFADVTLPRVQGSTTSGQSAPAGSFVDLENVQVLKGPQGTLFGRNTTGGAVLLTPTKPTDDLEGYVEGTIGDYDLWRATAVLNVPLADTFKIRAVVDRQHRDGYLRNQSGIGPDSFNDLDYFYARLGVLAELTPDLENYTVAYYSHSFTNGFASRIEAANLDFTDPRNGQLVPLIGPLAAGQVARQNLRGDTMLDVDVNFPNPMLDTTQWGIVNTTSWQASDYIKLKAFLSYSQVTEDASFSLLSDNFDIAPIFMVNAPYQFLTLNDFDRAKSAAAESIVAELQVQGDTPDNRLNWQAGAYFEKSNPLGFSETLSGFSTVCADVDTINCNTPIVVPNPQAPGGFARFGSLTNNRTAHEFVSKALYAQATYSISDQIDFTAGIRHTWDDINAVSESTTYLPLLAGGYVRFCYDSRVFPGPVTNASQCRQERSQNFRKLTWSADLQYRPSDNFMVYGKWSRGYRQGGISFTALGLEEYRPEEVDLFEIGARTNFDGAVRGYFNITGFYNDFRDQQLFATAVPIPPFTPAPTIINAGASTIWGIEADMSVTPFEGFRLNANYTYLNAEIDTIILPTPPAGIYSGFSTSLSDGDRLPLTPDHQLTLSANYTLPLDPSVGEITLGATYVFIDERSGGVQTLPQFENLPARHLLNLNLNWDAVAGSAFDLALFVTNVTDEIDPIQVTGGYFSQGFEARQYAPPRMFGARIRYNFGLE